MIYNKFDIRLKYSKEYSDFSLEFPFPINNLMIKEENNIIKVFNDYFIIFLENIENLREVILSAKPIMSNNNIIIDVGFEFFNQDGKKLNVLYYVIPDFFFNNIFQILLSFQNIVINKEHDFVINQEKSYDWLIKQKHLLILIDAQTNEPVEIYVKPDRADIIYKWVLNKETNNFKSVDIVSWDSIVDILKNLINDNNNSKVKLRALSGMFFVIKQRMMSNEEKSSFNYNYDNNEDLNEFFTKNIN